MISRKKLYVNFATAKYFPNFRLLLEKKSFLKKTYHWCGNKKQQIEDQIAHLEPHDCAFNENLGVLCMGPK